MKIIQTLWLPENNAPAITNLCGWLSPEYHWMSWVLSVNQLRKFYDRVELYTNEAGKEILIDQLNLPYTKVHTLPGDLLIPDGAWALSKIIVYSLQNEPFLHVDGDVYIWRPFDESLLTQALIVQNEEAGFDTYAETLKMVHENFKHVPGVFKSYSSASAYNAGIIGGSDFSFYRSYAQQAIDFVMNNAEQFTAPVNASSLCMLFEQWLFGALAKKENKTITTLLPGPITDNTYPGMADVLNASSKGYLHFMGITKKNRYSLKQMMSKVKADYTDAYYNTLTLCRQHSINLDFKIYQLRELDPLNHKTEYFQKVIDRYAPANIITESAKWLHYYGKDAFSFRQAEHFHVLDENNMHQQVLTLLPDVEIVDSDKDELQQYLKIEDTFSLESIEIALDEIEMIILDALKEKPSNILTLIETLRSHFDETDFNENRNALLEVVIEKVKKMVYQGVITSSR